MIETLIYKLRELGQTHHFGYFSNTIFSEFLALMIILAIGILLYFLCRVLYNLIVKIIHRKIPNNYNEVFSKTKVVRRLFLLIPAILLKKYTEAAIPDFPSWISGIIAATKIYEIIVYGLVLTALVNTANDLYSTFSMARRKPITGLVQVLKIIIFIVCLLLVIAFLMGKRVGNIIIGLGTLSAVLMLVFQNPILGFVGSIQLSLNDMLRIGDWIVVGPADGNVQEINLTTVKVQNWDNTITTIPTYTLITSPFTNWRGMSDSDGRRIMRSINIDVDTVRFCTPEMLERYKRYQLIKPYIEQREKEIAQYNAENDIDTSLLVNGRQQTNLGIFRAYLYEYVKSDPRINHNLTMLVRQLQPNDSGIPLQVYVFSINKEWGEYENVQSDLFDHIIAAVHMFDLRIYQRPSSNNIEQFMLNLKDQGGNAPKKDGSILS